MENNLGRSLSQLEAKIVLELEWQERHTIDRAEIAKVLGGSLLRTDRVIRSLRNKRWLERIARGRYLLIPADRGPEGIPEANVLCLGNYLVEPYYFGYATAAAYYRFTSQSRNTVWVITPKGVSDRIIRGVRFQFVNLVGRKFFGYALTKVLDHDVMMSDREKTVLDCVDKVNRAGGIGEVTRIIARAAAKIDWVKFANDAERFGSVATVQRFGYLAGRAGVKIPTEAHTRLRSCIKPTSRSYLGPPSQWGQEATYNAEWHVLVNVPEREITSEI